MFFRNRRINAFISENEENKVVLYEEPDNPYETISISAVIREGELRITDFEADHDPDGGASWKTVAFDPENTKRMIGFLMTKNRKAPYDGLAKILSEGNRLKTVQELCDKKKIKYKQEFRY